jgi:cytochrome c2
MKALILAAALAASTSPALADGAALFLAAPSAFAPGSKMFVAVPAAADRAALVAYLQGLK